MTSNDDFTIVPIAWIQDHGISLTARGLLVYLASHNGAPRSLGEIVADSVDSRVEITNALTELKVARYVSVDAHGYKVAQR